MATTRIQPVTMSNLGSGVSAIGGQTNLVTVTDGSDSTYIKGIQSGTSTVTVTMFNATFGPGTVPSDATINTVAFGYRGNRLNGTSFTVTYRPRNTSASALATGTNVTSATTPTDVTESPRSTAPSGGSWTYSILGTMQNVFFMTRISGGTNEVYIYELWADVDYTPASPPPPPPPSNASSATGYGSFAANRTEQKAFTPDQIWTPRKTFLLPLSLVSKQVKQVKPCILTAACSKLLLGSIFWLPLLTVMGVFQLK